MKTVPRRRSLHRTVTASDSQLGVVTPLALRRSRQHPDGGSLVGPAEAMEASVAAGGVERWTVVRSSEEPERVAHPE